MARRRAGSAEAGRGADDQGISVMDSNHLRPGRPEGSGLLPRLLLPQCHVRLPVNVGLTVILSIVIRERLPLWTGHPQDRDMRIEPAARASSPIQAYMWSKPPQRRAGCTSWSSRCQCWISKGQSQEFQRDCRVAIGASPCRVRRSLTANRPPNGGGRSAQRASDRQADWTPLASM